MQNILHYVKIYSLSKSVWLHQGPGYLLCAAKLTEYLNCENAKIDDKSHFGVLQINNKGLLSSSACKMRHYKSCSAILSRVVLK